MKSGTGKSPCRFPSPHPEESRRCEGTSIEIQIVGGLPGFDFDLQRIELFVGREVFLIDAIRSGPLALRQIFIVGLEVAIGNRNDVLNRRMPVLSDG